MYRSAGEVAELLQQCRAFEEDKPNTTVARHDVRCDTVECDLIIQCDTKHYITQCGIKCGMA